MFIVFQCFSHVFQVLIFVCGGLGKSHSLAKSDLDVLCTNGWEGGGGRAANKCIRESVAAVSLDMMPDERMQKEWQTDVGQCNACSTPRVTIWDEDRSS